MICVCDTWHVQKMLDRQTRLRMARLKAGFPSARSAAQRHGWSPSTYAAHENGQNDFDDDAALKYSKAFKVKPSWLYLGIDDEDGRFDYNHNLYGQISHGGVVKILEDKDPDRHLVVETGLKIDRNAKLFYFESDEYFPRYQSREVLVTIDKPVMIDDTKIDYRHDCICYLEDGRILFRSPRPTPFQKIFELQIFNSPEVIEAELVKVGVILAVLKRIALRIYRPGADDLSSRFGNGNPS